MKDLQQQVKTLIVPSEYTNSVLSSIPPYPLKAIASDIAGTKLVAKAKLNVIGTLTKVCAFGSFDRKGGSSSMKILQHLNGQGPLLYLLYSLRKSQ